MENYSFIIDDAFNKAEKGESKITQEIIEMSGMSGTKTRHFYNNLLNNENIRYLEIGTWKGSSVCSAMCNNKAKVVCIDNWSEPWGDYIPKGEFLINFEKFKGENDAQFIEGDCYNIDVESLSKFNIYMYDGNHSKENHYKALTYYYNCLDDIFIYIVDDWNWVDVRDGTNEAIHDLNLKKIYEKEVLIPWNDDSSPKNWHNGMYVVVLQKSYKENSL
jgi:hypothetical protein